MKVTKKTFVYKTINNISIEADLFELTDNRELKPGIIWLHGGGLIFGSRTDLPEEQLNFYLANGYNVLSIDYRLAPETKLPEIVNDIKDAFEWVHSNGSTLGIDSAKIFVIGHSGGAYLALISGCFEKNPPKAIVSFYGCGEIYSGWYNKSGSLYAGDILTAEEEAKKLISDSALTSASFEDRFDLFILCEEKGFWPLLVTGHNPVNEKQWYEPYCPIHNINATYPPVLLIHGDKDTYVPVEQSILLDKELESNNIRHKFIRVKNYGHAFDLLEGGLSNPDISKVFLEVIDFLNGIS